MASLGGRVPESVTVPITGIMYGTDKTYPYWYLESNGTGGNIHAMRTQNSDRPSSPSVPTSYLSGSTVVQQHSTVSKRQDIPALACLCAALNLDRFLG